MRKVHGYAVLRDALGAQRQKQFIDEFWKAMKPLAYTFLRFRV